ncbi:MAG: efflux RND transporter periplasmic adaptor subunit [Bacteroidota bacterium]
MKTSKIKSKILYTVAAIVAAAVMVSFIGKEEEAAPAPQLLAVKVANPVQQNIVEWDEYTGRFEASNRVEVRARVSGYIESVHFDAGQDVKKGDVLFVIDQRPFNIALSEAKAALHQAKAGLKQAEDNFKRVQPLRASGAISQEEYATRLQAVETAQARVELAQASVNNAKLNLEFATVKAPISGRVSRDLINPGNLISGGSANSTLLTTIVAVDPIHFYFTGSEADYLKYSRLAKSGERGSSRTTANPVKIQLQDETAFSHEGKMDFVDNEIDRSTGTIEARAILDNKDGLLEPGMFGRARLLGSPEHQALLIPEEIVGTNQSIKYVYVLAADSTIKAQNVELGPLHTNGLRIIRSGLSSDDKLIINNIQKIRPGAKVNPVEASLTEEINL